MVHAEAGRHCTVQNITPLWARHSNLMRLNHLTASAALTYEFECENLPPSSSALHHFHTFPGPPSHFLAQALFEKQQSF